MAGSGAQHGSNKIAEHVVGFAVAAHFHNSLQQLNKYAQEIAKHYRNQQRESQKLGFAVLEIKAARYQQGE